MIAERVYAARSRRLLGASHSSECCPDTMIHWLASVHPFTAIALLLLAKVANKYGYWRLFDNLIDRHFDDAARAGGIELWDQITHLGLFDHGADVHPVFIG
jgi:hypothetical protein